MDTNTEGKTSMEIAFEESRILRGFLAIVGGILIMFIGLVLYNILGAASAPWYAVEPFGAMYYVGILISVFAPLWYWFGRPIYYMRQLSA